MLLSFTNRLSLCVLLLTTSISAAPLRPQVKNPAPLFDRDLELLEALQPIADSSDNVSAIAASGFTVTKLSADQMATYIPHTHLAAASYCLTADISTWSCGAHCSALPGMVVYSAGGDNTDTPDWFVGYLPSISAAVVVHQGTTVANLESDFLDLQFSLTGLTAEYFPGADPNIEVHSGFLKAHDSTADSVLTNVEKIFGDHNVSNVVCVGHSLGGAIAALDALSLKLTLPADTSFTLVTLGQPRTGNQDFADYMDAQFGGSITRLTHNADPIPILPGRFLGFHHSSGETHSDPDDTWWACSGQDNTNNPQCSTGEVQNIADGNTTDHHGPYAGGIYMDC